MEMQALPGWVDPVAEVFVALAVLAAIAVAYDIYGRGYRQWVRSMEAVWALSALWLGPFALPLYARTGRPRSKKWQAEHPTGGELGLSAAAGSGGLPGGAAGRHRDRPRVRPRHGRLDARPALQRTAAAADQRQLPVPHADRHRPPGSSPATPAVALLLKRGTKVAV